MIEKYHFRKEEAESLAAFFLPMLECYPHKRISCRDAIGNEWLKDYTVSTNPRMDEKELLFYMENKQEQEPVPEKYDSEVNDGDSEDNSELSEELSEFGFKEVNIHPGFIDRSFTDLGYIGFGGGIDFSDLDRTGNWQFDNININ